MAAVESRLVVVVVAAAVIRLQLLQPSLRPSFTIHSTAQRDLDLMSEWQKRKELGSRSNYDVALLLPAATRRAGVTQ